MATNIHSPSQQVMSAVSISGVLTNGTVTGAAVDTFGYTRAKLVFITDTGSATTSNYTVTECDTSGGSYSSAITGLTLTSAVVASTTTTVYVQDLDLTKRKRFLKAEVVGTGTNGTGAVLFELYNAADMAVTQTNTPVTAV